MDPLSKLVRGLARLPKTVTAPANLALLSAIYSHYADYHNKLLFISSERNNTKQTTVGNKKESLKKIKGCQTKVREERRLLSLVSVKIRTEDLPNPRTSEQRAERPVFRIV